MTSLYCLPGIILLFVLLAISGSPAKADLRQSPIIGVLAQELRPTGLVARGFKNKTSYIASSYVKFLEGAGARVVPIRIGRNQSYYERIMQHINGVLLPGGATLFNISNGYAEAGGHLLRIAIQQNDNGTFMPIWGTCLGMELMVYKLGNDTDARINCSSRAQPLPLEFQPGFNQSRLFRSASEQIVNILAKENVTVNSHRYCYTQQSLAEHKLNDSWRVLSLNHDWNGIEFISSIEHIKYPFYAVQFHPEKPIYEFNDKLAIPHTWEAIQAGQYFANYFVNEARRNRNKFTNSTVLSRALIYNYKPEYTSPLGSAFEQQYLFNDVKSREFDDFDYGYGLGYGAGIWLFPYYYPYEYADYDYDGGAATTSISIALLFGAILCSFAIVRPYAL